MTDDNTSQSNLEHSLIEQAISASYSGDYEQSYLYYQRAFSLAPASATLNYNWAITALRRGDRDQLAACASRLTAVAPEDWRSAMAQAYLTEIDGEPERGWQSCQQAYEKVRVTEDLNEIGVITASVLRFAHHNQIKAGLSEVVEQVYEAGVFSERVLEALRKLEGKLSQHAFDYRVLIEGDFCEPAFPNSTRYIRNYRVLADNPEQARDMALNFESKCGEAGLVVSSVKQRGREESEVYLGVWWRSDARVIGEHS